MLGLTVLLAWRAAVAQGRWQVLCRGIRSTGSPRSVLAAPAFGESFSPVSDYCVPLINMEQLRRYLIQPLRKSCQVPRPYTTQRITVQVLGHVLDGRHLMRRKRCRRQLNTDLPSR